MKRFHVTNNVAEHMIQLVTDFNDRITKSEEQRQFLVADMHLYKRLCLSIHCSMVIELDSVKTRISAPAPPSATGNGRVSGLVI